MFVNMVDRRDDTLSRALTPLASMNLSIQNLMTFTTSLFSACMFLSVLQIKKSFIDHRRSTSDA